jgi:hypothetical protein
MRTISFKEGLKAGNHSKDLEVDGRVILKRIVRKNNVWIRYIWFRIGTGDGIL